MISVYKMYVCKFTLKYMSIHSINLGSIVQAPFSLKVDGVVYQISKV